ncbi:MAG: ABC transporter substrate-binding protein [Chloroflexi bacterium]|nr:ABC transporter substrate-binding protein [Chloroflexota bacterium]
MKFRRSMSLLAAGALLVGACTAGPGASPAPSTISAVGDGEGKVTVLAWPGYVEDGTTSPDVDWISSFEAETGCQVTVQTFGTSDEAFTLFQTNPTQYDVISASGDATLRLVAGGFVQPVNVDLIPSYAEIFPDLKDKAYNTVDGVHYGVPHGRGANVLMWRTDEVTTAPTSWTALFDPASEFAGKFSVYDAPIYIADAAVVLMTTNPELGIKNPYALDDTQFAAAIELLEKQKPAVGEYWGDYTKQISSFQNGNTVIGTTWQVIANVLQGADPPTPVEVVKPVEGATGWSDTWMINSKTPNINCSYKFVNHITSAPINIQIAEYFGEAPGNSKSCALATNPEHCAIYHAEETDYWTDVWYWTTPVAKCVDGRTDVTCKDFAAWVEAWTAIRSG